jgi:hypothetical protein
MLAPRTAPLCLLLLVAVGCADKQPKPVMVSAAGLPGYSIAYPDRLSGETAMLVADKQQAAEQSQKLGARTAELKPGADPAALLTIVQRADQAGRTEAFARANDEARSLRAFWQQERGPISARASGAAQKQLSEGSCGACGQVDLGGSLGYAIGAGIDKQLERRLRACNEAHRSIEYNEGRLGTGNLAAIEELADDVALTSYQVNVALPRARDRMDALLAEHEDVDATLARAIEWERSYQAGAPSPREKKASQDRLTILEQSRAALPAAVASARAARKDLDPQIEALRERYATTLQALHAQLEAEQARAANAK